MALPTLRSRLEGCGELRPAIERVGAFAGLDLDVFGDDCDVLCLGEARDGFALGFNSEARAVLLHC